MSDSTAETAARAWLREREGRRSDPAEVLAWFGTLPPAGLEASLGRWRGSELPTGHPLDGLLTSYGWYGKDFRDGERAHPLLFRAAGLRDRVVPVDPARLPSWFVLHVPDLVHSPWAARAFRAALPALRTSRYRARLRLLHHGSGETLAMIYDSLPIIDVFRRVDDRTLVGVMDRRDDPRPYFFVLRRDAGAR